jgi:predicted DNA-binding protein (MmcQ/YjbR family)
MVDTKTFRELASGLGNVTEQAHFEKQSFRINKKIFATLDEKNNKAVVKLPEMEQSVFCAFDKSIIYPANGAWGKQGWTVIELAKVRKTMLKDALRTSYESTSAKG